MKYKAQNDFITHLLVRMVLLRTEVSVRSKRVGVGLLVQRGDECNEYDECNDFEKLDDFDHVDEGRSPPGRRRKVPCRCRRNPPHLLDPPYNLLNPPATH